MATFFLCLAVVAAIPMVIQRDPVNSLILAVNPLFWTVCAGIAG